LLEQGRLSHSDTGILEHGEGFAEDLNIKNTVQHSILEYQEFVCGTVFLSIACSEIVVVAQVVGFGQFFQGRNVQQRDAAVTGLNQTFGPQFGDDL
jgi:hypothetical protein